MLNKNLQNFCAKAEIKFRDDDCDLTHDFSGKCINSHIALHRIYSSAHYAILIPDVLRNMTEDFSLKALVPYAMRLSIRANC